MDQFDEILVRPGGFLSTLFNEPVLVEHAHVQNTWQWRMSGTIQSENWKHCQGSSKAHGRVLHNLIVQSTNEDGQLHCWDCCSHSEQGVYSFIGWSMVLEQSQGKTT